MTSSTTGVPRQGHEEFYALGGVIPLSFMVLEIDGFCRNLRGPSGGEGGNQVPFVGLFTGGKGYSRNNEIAPFPGGRGDEFGQRGTRGDGGHEPLA